MHYVPFEVTWAIPTDPPVGKKLLVTMDGTLNTLRLATFIKDNGFGRWLFDDGSNTANPAFYLDDLIAPNSQPTLENRLQQSEMWKYVLPQNNRLYFRFDTDDTTVKENEEVYYDIQERLEALGWRLEEPVIEHDCISGTLQPKE